MKKSGEHSRFSGRGSNYKKGSNYSLGNSHQREVAFMPAMHPCFSLSSVIVLVLCAITSCEGLSNTYAHARYSLEVEETTVYLSNVFGHF